MASSVDPATPTYTDTHEWIKAYLTIHSLSIQTRCYSFILWLVILVIFLAFTVLHWSGLRGEFIGAIFSKWSLLRRTVTLRRKNRNLAAPNTGSQSTRQVNPLPSNAQLLTLSVLTLVTLVLAFAGPDYLAPSLREFRTRRSYDSSTFVSYMPQYTISKSLWSSSARTGQVAFALFPLCVLFALKAPPFAIFAISFMIQLCFDKLAFLHKWTARLIWFLVFIHVTLWSIQLAKDVNSSTGRIAYVYAWSYTPFRFGWTAFILLTLIVVLSLRPIRRQYYDLFYALHVLLVPCMLLTAGLHHPSVSWWCWIALSIWVGERVWRGTWWIYTNIIHGLAVKNTPVPSDSESTKGLLSDTLEMHPFGRPSVDSHLLPPPTIDERALSPLDAYYLSHDETLVSAKSDIPNTPLPTSLSHTADQNSPGSSIPHLWHSYIPPPGYVHAELLSGSTIRLRLITPGFLSWSPGQHFLISIPSVSRFTSHPFTCASVCDAAENTGAGRIMFFLVRRNEGWTKDLWDLVSRLTRERSRGDVTPAFPSDNLPKHGVLLRAYVDGPFGTVARVRWRNYSTAVIIVGGSGVSFGVSLLQYISMCLAGRDGKQLGARPGGWERKDAVLKRVRFIWLVREYSHIQWCASAIRYCTTIVPLSTLQVNIYVTNFKPTPSVDVAIPSLKIPLSAQSDNDLSFRDVPGSSLHSRSRSVESIESHESCDSDVDLSYHRSKNQDEHRQVEDPRVAHDEHMLDLTNFDGDVDIASPLEDHLNRKLKKEGKLRRRQTRRRITMKRTRRASVVDSEDQVQTSRHVRDTSPDSVHTTISRASTVTLHPDISLSKRSSSTLSEVDTHPSLTHRSKNDEKSDAIQKHLWEPSEISHESHATLISSGGSSDLHRSQHGFQMDEQEARDLNVVSEYTRPGRPAWRKVIADEMEASEGAVVVACCGPISLNVEVRKQVASLIDPERIRRGDMRGSITLISEEFDY